MKIETTIEFKTGKKISLTEEELQEIKDEYGKIVYYPVWSQEEPAYPYPNTITCSANTDPRVFKVL